MDFVQPPYFYTPCLRPSKFENDVFDSSLYCVVNTVNKQGYYDVYISLCSNCRC